MAESAVADTHSVVWWFSGQPNKLGREARHMFERAHTMTAVIYIPVLALAELSENIRRGRIKAELSFTGWFAAIQSKPGFATVDLTTGMVLRAEQLYAIPERGDRLIAATAAELDLPLITRDPEIARVAGVRTIW